MKLQYCLLVIFYLTLRTHGFKGQKGGTVSNMEIVAYKASVHIKQQTKDVRICSGAVIDAIHVLTTAACFHIYLNDDYSAYVRVGALTAHSGGIVHQVKKRPIIHPLFNVDTHRHNIAIVTLKEFVMELGSFINKIPINYDYITGCKDVTIIGFGEPFVSVATPAKDLYSATSITMDIFQCGDALQDTIASKYYFEETLCIKKISKDIEVCSSDEGALVIYKNQLIGILSQLPGGLGCSGSLPYLFTRIGHYHSWLNTHMNAHLFENAL